MSSVRRGQQVQPGGVSRREVLRVGGLSVVGLSVAEQAALARAQERFERRNCIAGSVRRKPDPARSIARFQRFRPISQSLR